MGVSGSCHCGAVRLEVPAAPAWAADCNCSLCTKRGALTCYYRASQVTVGGETATYAWGDRLIDHHHCPTCGCPTHWSARPDALARDDLPDEVRAALTDRMGINARLLDGFDPERAEIRKLDNRDL
jgi:hypothetical protein